MAVEPRERPAPGRLELVRAFVNTLDLDKGTDALAGAPQAAEWLDSHGLLSAGTQVGPARLRRIVAAREAFRAILVANATGESNDETVDAVAHLNHLGEDAGLVVRLSGPAAAAPEVAAGGVEGALGELVAIALSAISAGSWGRLKACPESTCHWVFYDSSRNRSARWCDMGVCGNRAKRRTFRRRHAAHG
jgi:predicted RNA-binding Zn ribbon-like protein